MTVELGSLINVTENQRAAASRFKASDLPFEGICCHVYPPGNPARGINNHSARKSYLKFIIRSAFFCGAFIFGLAAAATEESGVNTIRRSTRGLCRPLSDN